jgi:hypothetical protein
MKEAIDNLSYGELMKQVAEMIREIPRCLPVDLDQVIQRMSK